MSRVMCDAMDCKHMSPLEPIDGGEPLLGFCKAKIVNIFGQDARKCFTYEKSEGDGDERQRLHEEFH